MGTGRAGRAAGPAHAAGAAERERASVGRGGQYSDDCAVAGGRPFQPPAGPAAGQSEPVIAQRQHHLAGRPELGEPAEDRGDGLAGRLIGAQRRLPGRVVLQPGRQGDPQFALGRLVPHPGDQPALDQVELCLADRALKAEHQPVGIGGRIIDAITVGDQRAGHPAQV